MNENTIDGIASRYYSKVSKPKAEKSLKLTEAKTNKQKTQNKTECKHKRSHITV